MLKQPKQKSIGRRLDSVKDIFDGLDARMTPEYAKALKELDNLFSGKPK